jgi:hypothetical protein
VFSSIFRVLASSFFGKLNTTSILEIRLGLLAIVFVTSAVAPSIKAPSKVAAFIPMTVSIQLASPVAIVSVGEKASPFPLLSVGASVINVVLDFKCSQDVLRFDWYVTLAVLIILKLEIEDCLGIL